ncbi:MULTISPECIES: GYD domain-containing protein [unclassified Cupriavidus]|uniref:GYD domain-containing protein n=1 Tax=unclassified Cupriavidus TaxID=2640874 RepID=UPI0010F740FD|nr:MULTISPECIES: GYD domain-containing protein [unclassified Cupriavidus]MWL89083.1 GYD domain-containing protein [Cupriavidus sp. SW-Y-13]
MSRYIVLATFTDQGVRTVKETTKRAAAVREAAGQFGVKVTDVLWTLGKYDVVLTMEGPDDAAVTAFGLTIAAQGNVHTQTLRAFDADEMQAIIGKMR